MPSSQIRQETMRIQKAGTKGKALAPALKKAVQKKNIQGKKAKKVLC